MQTLSRWQRVWLVIALCFVTHLGYPQAAADPFIPTNASTWQAGGNGNPLTDQMAALDDANKNIFDVFWTTRGWIIALILIGLVFGAVMFAAGQVQWTINIVIATILASCGLSIYGAIQAGFQLSSPGGP